MGYPSSDQGTALGMLLILTDQMRKLRGKNHVVGSVLIRLLAIQPSVFLAVVQVHAFKVEPFLLF